MLRIFTASLCTLVCLTHLSYAQPTAKTLEKDMKYYHSISKEKLLNINDRLYLLYQLEEKYSGTNVDTTQIREEIEKLEPLREKKSPKSSNPILKDLEYYHKISANEKMTVNDMLYILAQIREKYEGTGIDLTPIDNEIYKLNPKWMQQNRPVVHKKTDIPENIEETPGEGIRPGDILGINVYPMEKFSGEVVVQENGVINLPLAGIIPVKGMTVDKLCEVIKAKLVRYVTDPSVNIVKHQFGKSNIIIAGEIRMPGIYLYSANMNISDLVLLSGGYTQNADESTFKVHRDKTTIKVNTKDFALKPNDIIEIPRSENDISVVGYVEKPGDYNYHYGITLSEVISLAGGVKKGIKADTVEVLRKTQTLERTIYKENLKKIMKGKAKLDFQLEPGDIILIPRK